TSTYTLSLHDALPILLQVARRNPDPIGPVADLIPQLVEQLLQLERGEEDLRRPLVIREQMLRPRPVPRKECLARRSPAIARRRSALFRRSRRIGERAEHPGDVLVRAVLLAPF